MPGSLDTGQRSCTCTSITIKIFFVIGRWISYVEYVSELINFQYFVPIAIKLLTQCLVHRVCTQ